MSFLKLILKNPFRKRSRAILSILGIGIGIITIVALGAITTGLVNSGEEMIHVGGSDFIVMGNENENINKDWDSKIANVSGVNISTEVYNAMVYTDEGYISLVGVNHNSVSLLDIKSINGTVYKENSNEIILGKLASEKLNKTVNDTVSYEGEEWKIVGVFETGELYTDEAILSSLDEVQKLMDDPDKISGMYVKVDKGVDVERVIKSIEGKYGDNLTVVAALADMEGAKEQIDMLNNAKWAISLLAIVVGGIGIINTMIMSVFERTREIGVLKSVGWDGKRIIGMILGESIVITIVAGLIGSVVAIGVIEAIASTGMLAGLVPVFTINMFLEAMGISLIVGVVGGLYPAIKANKLPPTEALRYE